MPAELSQWERRVFILAAQFNEDFGRISRFMGDTSIEEAITLYRQARARLLGYSPEVDETWLTIYAMSLRLGKSREWIVPRLRRYEILAIKPGAKGTYYPPEAYSALERLSTERIDPAGDWVGLPAISRAVLKSRKWCKKHLEQLNINPERRIDDYGREYDFYPPSSINILKEYLNSLVPAGDLLSIEQLACLSGLSHQTVVHRIEKLKVRGELRVMEPSNQLTVAYPPEIRQKILNIYPPADDWLTLNQMREIVGRTWRWFERYARDEGFSPEIRMTASGFPRPHYHYDLLAEAALATF